MPPTTVPTHTRTVHENPHLSCCTLPPPPPPPPDRYVYSSTNNTTKYKSSLTQGRPGSLEASGIRLNTHQTLSNLMQCSALMGLNIRFKFSLFYFHATKLCEKRECCPSSPAPAALNQAHPRLRDANFTRPDVEGSPTEPDSLVK